jgi:hypothetical protein
MDVQTVVANVLTFNTNTFVRPALQGLSDADLLKRPSEACNPIGWLFWHQTRVEDLIISHISGRPQTWVPAFPRKSSVKCSRKPAWSRRSTQCWIWANGGGAPSYFPLSAITDRFYARNQLFL